MKPKITIVIPIYNVEPYVARCLQSVISQTYQGPIECLIIDDCGTDKSILVVKQEIGKYHGSILFQIIRHDHNQGLSAARNTGIEHATGDYIFFVDSDDEISKDCIEKLAAPLTEEQYDILIGNMLTIGDDVLNSKLSLKLDDGIILRGKEIEKTYRDKWNMCAVNKLYKISFIRQHSLKFKEGLIHEDELWSLQVACLAHSLRVVNHVTYIYYVREGSITTAKDKEIRKSQMLKVIAAEISSFLEERRIFSEKAYMLMQRFVWQSLKPSLVEKRRFVRDYCELRKATVMPFLYRVRACGLHPRAQLQNIYYLMPPKLAAHIKYWCYQFKNANT